MAFAARADRSEMASINITPLVDVMLVLLVIFMVTAPLLDHRLSLSLPQPPKEKVEPPTVLELAVRPGDVFALDGQPLAAGALEQRLVALRGQTPGLVLKVAVDPDADYQTATTALAVAERAGIANIALD